jgi:hypothetical protein
MKMPRRRLLLLVGLLLAGCASAPPAPAWRTAGARNLEHYQELKLAGEEALAAAAFRTAVHELQKGGDLHALQVAELTACALQVAMLAPPTPAAYLRLEALEPVPANSRYLAFLQGVPDIDAGLLPAPYRELYSAFRQGRDDLPAVVARIEDPRSRLVAAGWLVQRGRESEPLLLLAADTAGSHGWKGALLAYLGRLQASYEGRQAADKARAVAERIRLLTAPPK